MSDRRSSADLRPDVEALLGAFPIPERDWESEARATEARLTKRGPVDELLLAAPLPAEVGEPGALSATATPLTNSGVRAPSLAELARRSVEKRRAEEREIARASLAIAAGERASSGDTRAAASALSDSAALAAAPSPNAPNIASASPAGGTRAWPKLALAAPLLAVAAAALLWLRRPAEPIPLVTTALPAATGAAKPTSAAAPPAGASPAATHADEAGSAPGIDPSTLPGEGPAKALEVALSNVALSAAAPSGKPPRSTSEQATRAGRSPARSAPAVEQEKVLPPDPTLRAADSSGGELPVKPSTGAVQAALGAVLSGARHCVAGDDAPSSAIVRFGSDGRVQNVTVSGAAAGKASGACIAAQLTKARVQPFAASNFSVNTTIRPD